MSVPSSLYLRQSRLLASLLSSSVDEDSSPPSDPSPSLFPSLRLPGESSLFDLLVPISLRPFIYNTIDRVTEAILQLQQMSQTQRNSANDTTNAPSSIDLSDLLHQKCDQILEYLDWHFYRTKFVQNSSLNEQNNENQVENDQKEIHSVQASHVPSSSLSSAPPSNSLLSPASSSFHSSLSSSHSLESTIELLESRRKAANIRCHELHHSLTSCQHSLHQANQQILELQLELKYQKRWNHLIQLEWRQWRDSIGWEEKEKNIKIQEKMERRKIQLEKLMKRRRRKSSENEKRANEIRAASESPVRENSRNSERRVRSPSQPLDAEKRVHYLHHAN
jgi:hypothetical protein